MALKIRVVTAPRRTGACGRAESQVRWVLDAGDTGWVIQRIDFNHDVQKCDGTADAELNGARDCAKRDTPRYWEAWRVAAGKVFVGNTAIPHGSDTYRLTEHASRKRRHSITGKVQFLPGYNLTIGTGDDDWQEGDIPAAQLLPTRRTQPTGWSADAARNHNLAVEWDCCATPPPDPTVTGDPTESDPGAGEGVKRMVPHIVSPSATRVAELLFSAPSWIEAGDDPKLAVKLLSRLRRISALHTDVVRGGVEFFIDESKRKKSYSLDEQSKLYLLNRYMFRLPRSVPRGQIPFFGGWLIPDTGGNLNPNWPFAVQKGGELALKGVFSGYMGDEFRALDEFDLLRRHYPRRWPATRKYR
jgi:hypothetical protein